MAHFIPVLKNSQIIFDLTLPFEEIRSIKENDDFTPYRPNDYCVCALALINTNVQSKANTKIMCRLIFWLINIAIESSLFLFESVTCFMAFSSITIKPNGKRE